MSQPDHPSFGDWLAARIAEAGYRSPTSFANAAGLQPSMVLRWIGGKVQPTPDALVKAAAVLPLRLAEVLARGLDIPELEEAHRLHPLAVRVNRVLTEEDLVPERDRDMVETIVDRILDPVERTYFRVVAISWEPAEKSNEGGQKSN